MIDTFAFMWTYLVPSPLRQLLNQTNKRHEQGDDDKADDKAEHDDQKRFHEAHQAVGQYGDFLVVGVGHLVEHGVQFARLLAHVDHILHVRIHSNLRFQIYC